MLLRYQQYVHTSSGLEHERRHEGGRERGKDTRDAHRGGAYAARRPRGRRGRGPRGNLVVHRGVQARLDGAGDAAHVRDPRVRAVRVDVCDERRLQGVLELTISDGLGELRGEGIAVRLHRLGFVSARRHEASVHGVVVTQGHGGLKTPREQLTTPAASVVHEAAADARCLVDESLHGVHHCVRHLLDPLRVVFREGNRIHRHRDLPLRLGALERGRRRRGRIDETRAQPRAEELIIIDEVAALGAGRVLALREEGGSRVARAARVDRGLIAAIRAAVALVVEAGRFVVDRVAPAIRQPV
mmetsp:Transcript_45486/g.142475  ORF Transcript_45486/g.142475 Transcript_45486/m.142475 type:complete len:300 (+) Transcript_45486:220-1119(+)